MLTPYDTQHGMVRPIGQILSELMGVETPQYIKRGLRKYGADLRAEAAEERAIRIELANATRTGDKRKIQALAPLLIDRPGLSDLYPASVKKFVDVTDTLAVTATGKAGAVQTDNLTPVAVASGAGSRNNMCIAIHSLQIRGSVANEAEFNDTITLNNLTIAQRVAEVRITILIDRQPNKTAITADTIWSGTTIHSPLDLDIRKRVKIVKDTSFLVGNPVLMTRDNAADTYSASSGVHRIPFKWYIPFKKPIRVEFNPDSTLGTIAQITENAFSIWIMSDKFTTTYYEPTLIYTSRIRFTDCT